MKVTFDVLYKSGDIVFHRLEENKKGIVKDFLYKWSTGKVEYLVVFGFAGQDEVWCCADIELSKDPVF